MSVDLWECIGELREMAIDMRHRSQDTGYGYFPGGDPNTFSPDHECSTEEERAAHKADCEKWNAGQREGLTRTACFGTQSEDGKAFALITPSGYGLGTYTIEDPQAADDAEKLEAIVSRLEAWANESTVEDDT